jgi:hypothetical protein
LREFGLPQYVLVPENIELNTALPDGSWDEFTDLRRWNTPGAQHGRVQYCADDTDVALARSRTMAYQSGFALNELIAGPALLDVEVTPSTAYDLTGPAAMGRNGLPSSYPDGAAESAVRHACRAAGDALFAAGHALVAVRPAESQVRTLIETLVLIPAATVTVTRRRRWGTWG